MRPDVVACTIIAHNYLPMARLVARSFLEHHPEGRFVVAIVDRPVESRLLHDECFDVLSIDQIDLGDEGYADMAMAYDVTEFATSVKPYVLRQLTPTADCVLYLDPDIYLFDRLDPLIEATIRVGWSLTPHCLEPMRRDGTGPTEREIMAAGVYNLGYIGVTERARPFLDWWAERLRRDAIIEPTQQLFTDQRWIDLAVPIFGPHIERSPSYNVAYWNFDQRNLQCVDGRYVVDDEPLRFFHFSGYDPKEPSWFSKYQPDNPRTLLSDHPVLAQLCSEYGAAMVEARRGGPTASYGWSEARPGLVLDRAVRRTFYHELIRSERKGGPPPPSPFGPDGTARFDAWLHAVPHDSTRRLPRYLDIVWGSRPDLQAHFPEVGIGDLDRFLEWARTRGTIESSSIALLGVPDIGPALPAVADADSGERASDGVDLLGYLNAELGVGEAGRLLSLGFAAAGVPVATIACRGTTSRQDHPFQASGSARHDVIVMAVNADQFGNVRHEFGADFFHDRYVIGQWFWEVETFPEAYHGAFSLADEVWATTRHVRDALLAAKPRTPVTLMPLPLVAPTVAPGLDRAHFGLDERPAFLFTFDFLSVFERKNPVAIVKAFRSAFPRDDEATLVLKTINGADRLRDLERLRWACRDRADIVLIEDYFHADVTGALLSACDCYVSLHRAEGLGLTMAEAMALGKPVIATAYSGNVDFMTDDTAFLVPWTPVKIGAGNGPYPASATWAEPDVAAAAAAMRSVVDDRARALERGRRAQQDLATRFSPEVTGRQMQRRLDQIRSTRHG